MWERKTQQWEQELADIRHDTALHESASHDYAAKCLKILELAQTAPAQFVSQNSVEQVRLLKMLLSNCSLPAVGSEPGPYDVQLLDADQRSLVSTWGRGRNSRLVSTLAVTLDLSKVVVENNRPAIRRIGDSWQVYPALVHRP